MIMTAQESLMLLLVGVLRRHLSASKKEGVVSLTGNICCF